VRYPGCSALDGKAAKIDIWHGHGIKYSEPRQESGKVKSAFASDHYPLGDIECCVSVCLMRAFYKENGVKIISNG